MSEIQLSPRQQNIMTVVSHFPNGTGIDGILANLHASISRRNLQRDLTRLIDVKMITRSGKGRATVYKLMQPLSKQKVVEYQNFIPISEDSRDIVEYIRRPIGARQIVSYDRNFIASYQPNKTWYLGESTRAYLHNIGNTDGKTRPAGTYGRAILNRLLIDLSWSSSRLEGNTYTRLDTQNLIEMGEEAQGKNLQETQMILNHKAAIQLLIDATDQMGFDTYTFLSLHGLLSDGLMLDPNASGRLRQRPVEIFGSVFRPLAIPQLIEELFREILIKVSQIRDPFEQAFFIMVHIPYLQPFEDVNKRVSRLGLNLPLLKHNLCPLTFLDVPEHAYIESTLGVYEMTRTELLRDLFVYAYERSTKEYLEVHKTLIDPDPMRLRYRQSIFELVAHIVRDGIIDTMPEIERYTSEKIPVSDKERFVEIVLDEIKRLHIGVLARYGLSPAEFDTWLTARKQ